MQAEINSPETLQEAIKYFADDQRAFEFMKEVRWPDGKVSCPRCGSDEVSFISTRKLWTCKQCKTKKQFTIRVGTILEDSPIKFEKWICAFWLIANAKNGIGSYEIGRALGVTQRTGWFMLQRIRLAMQNGSIVKMDSRVEVDETFIGAKARNLHKGKRTAKGTGPIAMTPVMGLLKRTTSKKNSRVVLKVVQTRRKKELQGHVRNYVLKGGEVHTDALLSYEGLNDEYAHQVIDHADCYAKGHVHTNGLENFWSLLKRTIKGTYVNVEPFHLFRYLDEQALRFNERKDNDQGRFVKAITSIIGKRLTWAKLTGIEAQAESLPV
jgi:transposase-like protein